MRIITTIGVVGLMACNTQKTEVEANVTPVFTSIQITPSTSITTSSALLCFATATDENNDVLTITYQWTNQSGTEIGSEASLMLSSDMETPGSELTCTATVTDGEFSETTSASVVVENTAPIVSNVTISPVTVHVDTLLECTYDVSDSDGETPTVSYSWTQNGTEVGTEPTLQLDAVNFSDDDVIVCTVTAEDAYEGSSSDSAQVVVGNTAPLGW